MIRFSQYILVVSLGLVTLGAYAGEHTDIQDRSVCAPEGIALGGYDLVSYYQPEGPILGKGTITAEYEGLTYQFVSKENKASFVAEPKRYLPTYLGWCSTNLAMGRLACPDYKNFKIENDRLLLFEHAGFTNGRDIWNSDPARHRQMADDNFARFNR